MTIELKNIVKRVGAEVHIHETSVAFESDGFNILLGTTLAGKTSPWRAPALQPLPRNATV